MPKGGPLRVAMLPRFLVCLAVTIALSGCAHNAGIYTAGHETEAQMEAVLVERIPAGTPLTEAQRFLEDEGFECSLRTQQADASPRRYLYCDRSDPIDFFVGRRWQVVADLAEDKIGAIKVSEGLVGP